MTIIAPTVDGLKIVHDPDVIQLGAPPTPEEVDWAEHHLAELPTVIGFSDDGHDAYEWREPEGRLWRRAGVVMASPHSRKRFRIHLYTGATVNDLAWLEGIVERARNGQFGPRFGWAESKNADGESIYTFSASRVATRGSADGLRLARCPDANCIESFHSIDEGPALHVADRVDVDGRYQIEIYRNEGRPWAVFVDTYGDCLLAPALAVSLAKDVCRMAAEAERLNAADQHRAAAFCLSGVGAGR